MKRCKRRGCGKRAGVVPKTRKVRREVYESDPYCSMECCREDHDAPLPMPGFYQRDYTKGATAA